MLQNIMHEPMPPNQNITTLDVSFLMVLFKSICTRFLFFSALFFALKLIVNAVIVAIFARHFTFFRLLEVMQRFKRKLL